MADCSEQKNPLQRSGLSQPERTMPALATDYPRVDERRYSDWIAFAAGFSRYLNFYESSTGKAAGNWEPFFTRDVSALLGNVAVQDVEAYRVEAKQRMDFLRAHANAGDREGLQHNFSQMVAGALSLAQSLDQVYLALPADQAFRGVLAKFIKAKLGPAFRRLLSYYNASLDPDPLKTLYSEVGDPAWKVFGRKLVEVPELFATTLGFSSLWWDGSVVSLDTAGRDATVFGSGTGVFERLNHAAYHFLFTSAFDAFTESFTRLVAEAETALAASLSENGHAPHYALFLAFLRLFRTAQDQINAITLKHLDFYYRDVLRLKPKGLLPNQAHLIAELAKPVAQAALPEGTLFKAGKDSQGKDAFYALTRETTFNKGKVAAFKAVYRDEDMRLYASPVMDSADGLGAELKTPLKEWHPFLNQVPDAAGTGSAIGMPLAQIGFAVASPHLFLAEGKRSIHLVLAGRNLDNLKTVPLQCLITTEKGWLAKDVAGFGAGGFTDAVADAGTTLELRIDLTGGDPGVTAFNPKVHGPGFPPGTPVIKCMLAQDKPTYGYDALKHATLTAIEVKVDVGTMDGGFHMDGARNLTLSNQNGSIDAAKPFQPWGALPEKDDAFVIGSAEMFRKRNVNFNLHIEWANRPSHPKPSPAARLQYLEGGMWKEQTIHLYGDQVCSSSQQRTFVENPDIPAEALVNPGDDYPAFTACARSGYMRVVLGDSFGHREYMDKFGIYLMNQSSALMHGSMAEGAQAGMQAAMEHADVHKIAESIRDTVQSSQAAASVLDNVGLSGVANSVAGAAMQLSGNVAGALNTILSDVQSIIPPPPSGNNPDPFHDLGNLVSEGLNTIGKVFDPTGLLGGLTGGGGGNNAGAVADAIARANAVVANTKAVVDAAAGAAADLGVGALKKAASLGAQIGADAAAKKALEDAAQPPDKPHLPVVSGMCVTYAAASGPVDLRNQKEEDFQDREIRFYQIGPFGLAEQHWHLTGETEFPLVPPFRSADDASKADTRGECYIGMRDIGPEQAANLLFQVVEGTTNPLQSKPSDHIEWSYLSGNRWRLLRKREVSDATLQLTKSGIIGFTIPGDAKTDNTLLDPGMLWLRASVTQAVDEVCKIRSVQAQAMLLQFLPQDNAPDFLDRPIPAGTISKPKELNPLFKSFSQPYSAFGGRQSESGPAFYRRSSERLRHRGRAATIWDYEHLVLEAFPQLYRVKCLNHTQVEDGGAGKAIYNENRPGYVALIAIPRLAGATEADPLKPYADQGLLLEIQRFLEGRVTGQLLPNGPSPAQTRVAVCNPTFEEIHLEFKLRLNQGFADFSYYRQRLQNEITRFLSPWAFDDGSDVQFGGRIAKSSIIDFIEDREYVDFVTDLELKQKLLDGTMSGDLEEAAATTSRSILVSARATDHAITQHA